MRYYLSEFLSGLLLSDEVGVSGHKQLCGRLLAEEKSEVSDLGTVIGEDILQSAPGFEVGLTQGQEGRRVVVQYVHQLHCKVLALEMAIF